MWAQLGFGTTLKGKKKKEKKIILVYLFAIRMELNTKIWPFFNLKIFQNLTGKPKKSFFGHYYFMKKKLLTTLTKIHVG
jgi:hypothetical protein